MEEYINRSDLTDEEKEALRNYQDIGNKQHLWSCEIPNTEEHHDCYVINRCLRDESFRMTLSDEDTTFLQTIIDRLDRAIEKSKITESVLLIKGLDDAEWIRSKVIGEIYTDDGYGSFSASWEHSMKYASPQSDGSRVFILQYSAQDCCGVYMGHDEEEILLRHGIRYVIDNVYHYPIGELFHDYEAIVYYVSEI